MKKRKTQKRKEKRKLKEKNTEYTVVLYLFLFLFIGLIAYFVYFQIVESEDFINNPYNSLQDLFSSNVVRGEIQAKDGEVLAKTEVDSEGNETRVYPYNNVFAHVVGYTDNGKTGLETNCNFDLLRSHEFFLQQLSNELQDNKNQGDNVITTLDASLQQSAYDALGSNDGAVIVLEAKTGKILAMVSKPDYNPNTILADWGWVNGEGSTALYNRATQGQYAPGSTFKIFTALEYYKENKDDVWNYAYSCDGGITLEGQTIHCAGNKAHYDETIVSSFANSCNASFANMGTLIDNDKLMNTCNGLLFNKDLPVEFISKASKFSLSNSDSTALTMETCIGQGNTLVSPLHLAMISAAVCNDGVAMKPYLVDHVESIDEVIVRENEPKKYKTFFNESETEFLRTLMSAVVSDGTASYLSGQSYFAAGKTGTAQVSDSSDQTNSLFTGYATKEGYEPIAIAVVLEDNNGSWQSAVTVSRTILDSYFQ